MRCADNQPRSVGNMWTAKKPKNELPLALARRSLRQVEMLLPLETGTIRGQPRDAGTAGKPVVLAGTWHWRAARGAGEAGQLADPERRGRQGPLHLIRGGGLVAFCPTKTFPPRRHAGRTPTLSGG